MSDMLSIVRKCDVATTLQCSHLEECSIRDGLGSQRSLIACSTWLQSIYLQHEVSPDQEQKQVYAIGLRKVAAILSSPGFRFYCKPYMNPKSNIKHHYTAARSDT